jgi:hypothetical protein
LFFTYYVQHSKSTLYTTNVPYLLKLHTGGEDEEGSDDV